MEFVVLHVPNPGSKINVHVNYIVLRREMCILHACYCIVFPPPSPPGGPAVHAQQSAREHQTHCTKHTKRLIQVREIPATVTRG